MSSNNPKYSKLFSANLHRSKAHKFEEYNENCSYFGLIDEKFNLSDKETPVDKGS